MGAFGPATTDDRNARARGASLPSAATLCATAAAVAGASLLGLLLGHASAPVPEFWPANALLLVIVLRAARANRGAYLLAGLAANIVTAFALYPATPVPAVLAACDTLQVAVAAWLIAWRAGDAYREWPAANRADAYLWAVAVAPAFGATLAALVVSHGGSGSMAVWFTWYARGALGTAMFVPLGLALDPREARALVGRRRLLATVPTLGALLLTTQLVFGQEAYPALFVIFPVLVIVSFRLGATGAAISVLLVGAIAIASTASGHGPLMMAPGIGSGSRLLEVQVFLAVATWTALPIATLLHERNELLRVTSESLGELKQSHGELARRNEQVEALIALEASITAALPSRRAVLEVILDFAQRRSSASGTTMERVRGDVLIVELATGALAATVGASFDLSHSLSGECVKLNEVLYSADTLSDPRVQTEQARRFNMLSSIVVPIALSGTVDAVLKIASDRKHAFDDYEVLNFKLLAHHLASAMRAADEFEQLQLAQAEAQATIEHLSEGVVVFSADRTVLRHNAAAQRVLGLTAEDLRAYRSPPGSVVDIDGRELPLEERPVRRAFETGEAQLNVVLGFGEPGGARRWVSESVTPVRFADGQAERYILAARDVTALQQSELDHREYTRQLRSLHLIASKVTANGKEQIDAALALCRQELELDWAYLGSLERDGTEFSFSSSVGSNSHLELYAVGRRFTLEGTLVARAIASDDVLAISDLAPLLAKEPRLLAQGDGAWKAYIAAPVRVSDGIYGAIGFVGRQVRTSGFSESERDFVRITATLIGSAVERTLQRERLDALAYCDTLTGLSNRLVFEDRLAQTVLTAKRYDERFAVLYLDLDGFKAVNDGFGHGAGDEVLKVVARRLEANVRESDTVARIGGDEFLVLAPKISAWSDASDLAWRLVRAMRVPIEINGVAHRVSASVGVSVFPEDGLEAETLVKRADAALYRAKLATKDSVGFVRSA